MPASASFAISINRNRAELRRAMEVNFFAAMEMTRTV